MCQRKLVDKIEPEPTLGPMVCHESIKLTDNELKVLLQGQKFMIRDKINLENFLVEQERMIAKFKFNESEEVESQCMCETNYFIGNT